MICRNPAKVTHPVSVRGRAGTLQSIPFTTHRTGVCLASCQGGWTFRALGSQKPALCAFSVDVLPSSSTLGVGRQTDRRFPTRSSPQMFDQIMLPLPIAAICPAGRSQRKHRFLITCKYQFLGVGGTEGGWARRAPFSHFLGSGPGVSLVFLPKWSSLALTWTFVPSCVYLLHLTNVIELSLCQAVCQAWGYRDLVIALKAHLVGEGGVGKGRRQI